MDRLKFPIGFCYKTEGGAPRAPQRPTRARPKMTASSQGQQIIKIRILIIIIMLMLKLLLSTTYNNNTNNNNNIYTYIYIYILLVITIILMTNGGPSSRKTERSPVEVLLVCIPRCVHDSNLKVKSPSPSKGITSLGLSAMRVHSATPFRRCA